jgi:hypothetical protein
MRDGCCRPLVTVIRANVMVDGGMLPWLTDFSFSELAATQRQKDLDLAELLASLATLAGADMAVSSAVAVIGAQRLAPVVPLLQPLALSAASRHAVAHAPVVWPRPGALRGIRPPLSGGTGRA